MKHMLIYLLIVFLVSCIYNTKTEKRIFQYYKENINTSMKYNELVKVFGEPDDDIGRGIHIYVYRLKDNTKISIGYADSILYVRHMDVDNKMIVPVL